MKFSFFKIFGQMSVNITKKIWWKLNKPRFKRKNDQGNQKDEEKKFVGSNKMKWSQFYLLFSTFVEMDISKQMKKILRW